VTTLPVIFCSVNFYVVIVDASVLYLIKYFIRSQKAWVQCLLCFEIVIEDSEVFYLFLFAKK